MVRSPFLTCNISSPPQKKRCFTRADLRKKREKSTCTAVILVYSFFYFKVRITRLNRLNAMRMTCISEAAPLSLRLQPDLAGPPEELISSCALPVLVDALARVPVALPYVALRALLRKVAAHAVAIDGDEGRQLRCGGRSHHLIVDHPCHVRAHYEHEQEWGSSEQWASQSTLEQGSCEASGQPEGSEPEWFEPQDPQGPQGPQDPEGSEGF